jgi:hypothetical protein
LESNASALRGAVMADSIDSARSADRKALMTTPLFWDLIWFTGR